MFSGVGTRVLTVALLFVLVSGGWAFAAEMPDKALLDSDPDAFFRAFGAYAVGQLPNGGKDATNLEKSRQVIRELDKIADRYGLNANVRLAGRRKFDTYTCGWWQDRLTSAFSGAGIPNTQIHHITSEELEYTGLQSVKNPIRLTNVNRNHTAVFIEDNNGELFVFDPWQQGFDRNRLGDVGIASIGGVGASKYNGMKVPDWIKLQEAAGRTHITLNGQQLIDSPFLSGHVNDALIRNWKHYGNRCFDLFGGRDKMQSWLSNMLCNTITGGNTVNAGAIDDLLNRKLEQLANERIRKLSQTFGNENDPDKKRRVWEEIRELEDFKNRFGGRPPGGVTGGAVNADGGKSPATDDAVRPGPDTKNERRAQNAARIRELDEEIRKLSETLADPGTKDRETVKRRLKQLEDERRRQVDGG